MRTHQQRFRNNCSPTRVEFISGPLPRESTVLSDGGNRGCSDIELLSFGSMVTIEELEPKCSEIQNEFVPDSFILKHDALFAAREKSG